MGFSSVLVLELCSVMQMRYSVFVKSPFQFFFLCIQILVDNFKMFSNLPLNSTLQKHSVKSCYTTGPPPYLTMVE